MNNQANTVKEENFIAGLVGAFLFSLVGGIVWYGLYQIGFIAAISGIIGVVCAIKGYAVFGKKESLKGVIFSVIIAAVVLVIAQYFCLATDVYNAYKEWFAAGEIDFTVSFGEAVAGAHIFLADPAVAAGYIKDLAIGLLLCVFGAFGSVRLALAKAKAANKAPTQPTQQSADTDFDFPTEAPSETTCGECTSKVNYCGKSVAANYYRGIEAVGGKLFFDNTGMTFKSHAFNIQVGESRIEYRDIAKAEVKGAINGMSVYTKDGVEHKFVVWHRKDLVEYINCKVI